MVDRSTAGEGGTAQGETARSPHRHGDPREAIAELTERAHQISKEAGGKVAAAMRDVVSAAAGLAGFAVESARDLVQYMVRRGQMTQDEADRLLRDVEAAHAKRPESERSRPTATKVAADRAAEAKAARAAAASAPFPTAPARTAPPTSRSEAPKAASAPAPAAKGSTAKPAKASSAKPAAKGAAAGAKKPAATKQAAKSTKPAKSASKPAKSAKAPAKKGAKKR